MLQKKDLFYFVETWYKNSNFMLPKDTTVSICLPCNGSYFESVRYVT